MLTEKDYNEFVSLVKRMREAQIPRNQYLQRLLQGDSPAWHDYEEYRSNRETVKRLEAEVDEYLKNIEV